MPKLNASAELQALLDRPRQPLGCVVSQLQMMRLERAADKMLARAGFFETDEPDYDAMPFGALQQEIDQAIDPAYISRAGHFTAVCCGTV
jgi:hypothetical protein